MVEIEKLLPPPAPPKIGGGKDPGTNQSPPPQSAEDWYYSGFLLSFSVTRVVDSSVAVLVFQRGRSH